MKVVTAIDSFKGSMTSMEAGFAAAEGIHRVDADAEVQVRPLADGGEGTVEALVAGMNGKTEHVKVTGPLGEPVICEYGIIESTKTAVIEMAGAAGITQVPDEKRNPLYTTTYGVGEVIKDAIEKGCRRFIVGIGGSATNDGGVGMLQALGYAFLDKDGKQVLPGARGLKDITEITAAYVIPELAECKFRVACDVKSSLRRAWMQCHLRTAEGCYTGDDPGHGSVAGCLRRACKGAFSESRSKVSGNRCCRRNGICIPDLYRCSSGIRDQHRAG